MPTPTVFPLVQAPSTRVWRSQDDFDIEAAIRRITQGGAEEDPELNALAERVARTGGGSHGHGHGKRPAALKRHETA
jgi:hypothetical protein